MQIGHAVGLFTECSLTPSDAERRFDVALYFFEVTQKHIKGSQNLTIRVNIPVTLGSFRRKAVRWKGLNHI